MKKVTYELIYTNGNEEYITTYGYKTLEDCKDDIKLYTGENERVTGILKTEVIETKIPINEA